MKVWMKVNYGSFYKDLSNHSRKVKQAVSRETNRAALRVEKQAKHNAPWDTGWLANNIYSTMVTDLRAEIHSPVHYSIYNELGTRYMAATPFLYPALKEVEKSYFNNLRKIVGG